MLTADQRAQCFYDWHFNQVRVDKSFDTDVTVAKLMQGAQTAAVGHNARRAHNEQNVIQCCWDDGALGTQLDLTRIGVQLWSACMDAKNLPEAMKTHPEYRNKSTYKWKTRFQSDYTHMAVVLAASCSMGPMGSAGNAGDHRSSYTPLKKSGNYHAGHLESEDTIPKDMKCGFIVPFLQNITARGDPHSAFVDRNWKTIHGKTHVSNALSELKKKCSKGVWSKT